MELRPLAKWDVLYMWCPQVIKVIEISLSVEKSIIMIISGLTWGGIGNVSKVDYLLTEVLAIQLKFGYIQIQCWHFKEILKEPQTQKKIFLRGWYGLRLFDFKMFLFLSTQCRAVFHWTKTVTDICKVQLVYWCH